MKVVYVNPSIIKSNAKVKRPVPPIEVESETGKHSAFEIEIRGPSRVVYNKEGRADSGVRVWIETDAPICLDGKGILP